MKQFDVLRVELGVIEQEQQAYQRLRTEPSAERSSHKQKAQIKAAITMTSTDTAEAQMEEINGLMLSLQKQVHAL